jgi:hypothetical protein
MLGEVIVFKGKTYDNKEKKFNKITISRDTYCRVFWVLCSIKKLKMSQLFGGSVSFRVNTTPKGWTLFFFLFDTVHHPKDFAVNMYHSENLKYMNLKSGSGNQYLN